MARLSAEAARRHALGFVLTIGLVSLFADMAYEGARSINGPWLAQLGASGAVVGIVAGLGELLGYGLRLFSGRLSDRSRAYWPVTIVGYVVQMAAVPALALAGSWPVAAAFIVLERIGKALRNPPRDAMLAEAGSHIGRGWAFGLHEALDQAGALVGPLAVALVLALRADYPAAFAMLALPAALTLISLAAARISYPDPTPAAAWLEPVGGTARLPRALWVYVVGAALVGAGFADFSLLAYHFERTGTLAPIWIPVAYALAMGAGGLGALVCGRLFDRLGVGLLVPITVAAALYAPLGFLGSAGPALLGTVLWGLGTGVHESILAAAVGELVPSVRLASAYGLFTTIYGLAWFLGSAAMGILYDRSIGALVGLSVVLELAALPCFWHLRGRLGGGALRPAPASP